ncbi:MAG: hypothetical protein WDO13_17510 [Verrucomicrobiota bacterium]
MRVGRLVTVGHRATLHACTVEDECLIGMGATILDGAVIGRGSIVGAHALVTGRTRVPPGSLVMGMPAKVVRALRPRGNRRHPHLGRPLHRARAAAQNAGGKGRQTARVVLAPGAAGAQSPGSKYGRSTISKHFRCGLTAHLPVSG